MRLDDAAVVREEYARPERLAARASVYAEADGPDARDVVLAALREVAPRRVLEVGCGAGELASRIGRELGADVVALDLSPQMVELARRNGVDARLGDVQDLPFPDGAFDCAVAAWMLYHVPRLEDALAELERVLRPAGRLVAVTNSERHLGELWELVGGYDEPHVVSFSRESGARWLAPRFRSVDRLDVNATVEFADAAAVRGYVASSVTRGHLADRVPELEEPLRATRSVSVFVADKA